MRVLALDPGERVGWARATVADDGEWTGFRHGITPLRDMAIAVNRALCHYPHIQGNDIPPWDPDYDVVVIEDWRLYPHMAKSMTGSSFPAVQFIGAVRLCCWVSATKLVTQGAAIKTTADKTMAAIRPELFAKVTAPRKHDDAHDMDAIRHLWYFTWKTCDVADELYPEGVA